MSELIEHPNNDGNESDVVQVGETNRPVSLKVYQDIYHQVTGRTEQIRKRQFENLLIEFGDIEQLHHKIAQLCDVHRVVAKNESMSIFHSKERKEEFTSFARLQAYNTNTASPCVSLLLKYHFSLIPGGLQKPQEYIVTVRLTSRVALLDQLMGEAPLFLRRAYFGYSHESTAEIIVDYVDYVVARGFLEAFDEWMRGCKKVPQSKVLNIARSYSHRIPLVGRLVVIVLLVLAALRETQHLGSINAPATDWARLAILFFGGAFILTSLVSALGSYMERAIDSYPELSYLKLNKGDSNLIDEFVKKRKRVILKFLGACALTIALGVLSAKLERLL